MTRHEAYNGIYDTEPSAEAHRVFFAFSEKGLLEGMKECGYKDKSEIVSSGIPGMGLFGSAEAILSFLDEYRKMNARVAQECDPQKVYDYEFDNCECGYICDDERAIKTVVETFGAERARQVKRQNAWVEV